MTKTTLLAETRMNQRQSAKFLGISSQTWHKMKIKGQLPKPMVLGDMEFWLESQLEQWAAEQNPHLIDQPAIEQMVPASQQPATI